MGLLSACRSAGRSLCEHFPQIARLPVCTIERDVWFIQVNRPLCGKCAERNLPADLEESHSPCPSQVNSLRARAQSCMCWSSEHGAIGAAPEQFLTETVPFLTVSDEKSVRSYIKNLLKKAERISTSEKQRKFGSRSRMMEKIARRAEQARRLSCLILGQACEIAH